MIWESTETTITTCVDKKTMDIAAYCNKLPLNDVNFLLAHANTNLGVMPTVNIGFYAVEPQYCGWCGQ